MAVAVHGPVTWKSSLVIGSLQLRPITTPQRLAPVTPGFELITASTTINTTSTSQCSTYSISDCPNQYPNFTKQGLYVVQSVISPVLVLYHSGLNYPPTLQSPASGAVNLTKD
jgi:hypothetical protein